MTQTALCRVRMLRARCHNYIWKTPHSRSQRVLKEGEIYLFKTMGVLVEAILCVEGRSTDYVMLAAAFSSVDSPAEAGSICSSLDIAVTQPPE